MQDPIGEVLSPGSLLKRWSLETAVPGGLNLLTSLGIALLLEMLVGSEGTSYCPVNSMVRREVSPYVGR